MGVVVKVGGNELDDLVFLAGLTRILGSMAERPVVVHGGGRELSAVQQRLGLESRFVDGLRVTDEESLAVAEMVLRGRASLRVVSALASAGIPALGLSGVDAGLVSVEKLRHSEDDLGYVGRPVAVATERLRALLDAGFLPVLAPIGLGVDGHTYNVNADHIAAAVAAALDAELLIFLTNVPGVLFDGRRAPRLSADEVEAAIAGGTISGGMIPKVRAALAALEQRVHRVVITDLEGFATLTQGGEAGTMIVR